MKKQGLVQLVRFGIVGVTAVAIQYGVYLLLLGHVGEVVANTVGYIVSMTCNFLLSTYFTFRVSPSRRRAAGFALSHLINWGLQTGFLNLFLWLGVPPEWAPWPMFAVCVPINFLLVRHFLVHS